MVFNYRENININFHRAKKPDTDYTTLMSNPLLSNKNNTHKNLGVILKCKMVQHIAQIKKNTQRNSFLS